MAQSIVNSEMAGKDVLGGCPIKGQPPCKIQVSPMSTPFSQMSSDPLTPSLSHLPDPMGSPQISCGGIPFTRTYSGGSTVVPDSAPMTPLMPFQTDPSNELSFRPFGSLSSDPYAGLAFSRTVSCESNYVTEERVGYQATHGSPAKDLAPERAVKHLEDLLEEVKGMYNSKYPLDHVDDSGYEVGSDVDGLTWVRYTGQGRSQVEKLQDLLSEVKALYNAAYPMDHVDDIEHEIGYDADGMLWVKSTGQGVESGPVDRLEDLLEQVKGLYNEKYPLDHIDVADCDVGYDTDGLLWVKYVGQGVQTPHAKAAKLMHLLDEVKGLYHAKYPFDNVDDVDAEVGIDADGLLWVEYAGDGVEMRDTQVGDLEELLEEVKHLYNERYPLDHIDDVGREVGQDADGLLWVQHIGQGLETQGAKIERLEVLLEEVKGLYNEKYPLDHADDVDHEVGRDADGLLWVQCTGHSTEARELKMEELLDLLEEVKCLYNERYLLDHVDYVSCEVGRDADGLLWVQHFGQGFERTRTKADELHELLQEVKALYNEKYPHDHVDDDEREVGRDEDGLLWVQYTGHHSRSRDSKIDELLDLVEEVKALYNEQFPLDHVDNVECEMGRDADGLLWVMHTGQGVQTRCAKIEQLEDLLEEVKGLYNQKYPHDHADDLGHEVGYDADGLLWVKHTGRSHVDDLLDMLEEVKSLYNEKYPLDHVDDEDREIGCDFDGLVWTKYTGQGVERSQVERLEDLLQEVKCLYNARYPEDSADDAGREVGCDADGMPWVSFTGQGVERSEVEKLEDLLAEVKDLYNKRYPQDHADASELEVGTDDDGLLWVQYTGQGPKTWDDKVGRLEDLLEEVKDLYNDKYPQDHVDDSSREVGTDADGLLWVKYMGHHVETQEQKVAKLEDYLQEVKALYNERYPHDHVDDMQGEVGIDVDGLLWVKYTGHSAETREQKMDDLQDLLGEVKALYREKYPLDHLDEAGHEIGIDADGLLWVAYIGQGANAAERKVECLEELLDEVKDLYNSKYPLDHVDDVETEVGHDLDGLLWVRYTGSGGRLADQMQQLEELLEEVKSLYGKRYPLDCLEDEGVELGYDADGLLWVETSGLGIQHIPGIKIGDDRIPVCSKSKVEHLQDMLNEVRRLYNEKYPLDSVDDWSSDIGCDADGLLWVRYTGIGPIAA